MCSRRSPWHPRRKVIAWLAAALPLGVVEAGVQLIMPASREAVVLHLDIRAERWATAALTEDRGSILRTVDRLQYQHRFAEAEGLLTQLLKDSPQDTDALLQRAQLRVTQQNARGALADCLRAAPRLDALAASACQAQALGALGQVASARRLLDAALTNARSTPGIACWAQGIAAELAARDGAFDVAEHWHRAALAGAGDTHYPRIAYAQFLLQQKRPEEALQLLAATPDSPSVMQLRRRALELRP